VVPERVVTVSKVSDGIGLIRISMFPGVLGMDVAREISRTVSDLACDRLIFDLRGNTGGGIGCLRVMSHLCPDRRGVGSSATRQMVKNGFDKNHLPAFDRIPSSKLGVLPLVFRFVIPRRRSVAVFTERLGMQGHHGRVAVLVNQPVATFLTWQGSNLEGTGVSPDVAAPVDPSVLMQGHDVQLQRAVETVCCV
jgi:C-terminal processing protease CtpA/Prc